MRICNVTEIAPEETLQPSAFIVRVVWKVVVCAYMATLFGSLPQVTMHFRIHLGLWHSDGRRSETEAIILFWTYDIQPDIAGPSFLGFSVRQESVG